MAGRGDEDRSLGLARVEAERVEAAIGQRQKFKAVEQLVLALHQEVAQQLDLLLPRQRERVLNLQRQRKRVLSLQRQRERVLNL